MSKEGKGFYEFGPFRIDPTQRLLLRDNQPVPLQPKAFDTLLALVQRSGKVVLKEDLMKTVWPDTFVEESNLTQNIFVLRKTLGELPGERRYIVTMPGRGYRFAEDVQTVSEETVLEEDEIVVESHSRSRAGDRGGGGIRYRRPEDRPIQRSGGSVCWRPWLFSRWPASGFSATPQSSRRKTR